VLNIFLRLFEEGGWVVVPIFLVSVVTWHIALGKLLHFARLRKSWRKAHSHLTAEISARSAKVETGYAPFDNFVECVERPEATSVQVERLFDELLVEVSPKLNSGLSTISAIAVIAPLLGLLGTISGMNEMFKVIGEFGFGNPTILSNSISMALQATLTGMAVAVAALFFLDNLNNSKNKIIDHLRQDRDLMVSFALNKIDEANSSKGGAGMHRNYRSLHEEHQNPEINLAPFVDTIMILLIFFVVTANLYVETGINVSRPKASSASAAGAKAILIGITREGTVHMYGRQVSMERLRMIVEQEVIKQPDVSVVIISDRDGFVGRTVEVLDQCTLAGVQKISVAAGKD